MWIIGVFHSFHDFIVKTVWQSDTVRCSWNISWKIAWHINYGFIYKTYRRQDKKILWRYRRQKENQEIWERKTSEELNFLLFVMFTCIVVQPQRIRNIQNKNNNLRIFWRPNVHLKMQGGKQKLWTLSYTTRRTISVCFWPIVIIALW